MIQTILLTGATGFLGSHILKRLMAEGKDVVILIRETSNLRNIKNLKGFSTFILNEQLTNFKELFEFYKIDTIIHVATEYGRDVPYSSVLLSNVYFPIKLLEEGEKFNLKLFINTDSYFSKFKKYSYLSGYNLSKMIFKEYLLTRTKFQVINMQLEHAYGENDSENKFTTTVINKLRNNENSIKLSEGNQKRDFIYIEDVVNAFFIVLSKSKLLDQYSEFEVGTGVSISIMEFVNLAHQIIGSKSELLFGALPNRLNEIQDSKANNSSLINLGWQVNVPIEIGIKNMLL
jgi:nucleoside-diphosphate-sugar epimerase